ncbi:site-specific integrase [Williamsia sterculiae]|uniref:Site-specific recombinase XerD n=1 Tax=Williamsia sterculiae TaxID=1344003 RepID=A0A1N7FDP9_9NOCA|nr:site-specific integrase [Williamsia sterculiae]SIR98437.1 Site-specific recombinase XerD [Williamsia sterculiae]
MATISSYDTQSGKRYRVRYRTPDHRQTDKRGFRTKREAEAFAATVEVEKLTGAYIAPKLGLVTVAELGPEWVTRKQATTAASWGHSIEVAWRTHVLPRWGSTRISDINTLSVESWIADLAAAKSATVVLRAHGILAGILDDAVKSRRLAANPSRLVGNLPKKNKKKHVYLQATDVDDLAAAAGPRGTIVYVLAYCGIRWGELVALRVSDVEFLRRRLSIHRNAVWVGQECVVGETKGKESRSVPVPQFVLDMLSVECRGKGADDLVFPSDAGGYRARPKSGRGWFAQAVKRSGVDATTTPHSLRHTCASLTVSAGGNVLALARMLGHKDASVTLRVYSDLFDSDLDALGIALDERYSPRSVGKVWAAGSTPPPQ